MIRLLSVLALILCPGLLTGCSLFHHKNPAPEISTTPPLPQSPPPAKVESVDAPAIAPLQESVVPSAVEKSLIAEEAAKLPSSPRLSGVAPETALMWLRHGNVRFVKGLLRKDGQSKKDILRVALKQKPHAIIFSSSDSRVPPELIFDQKLGEIFVIRNWGGTLDPSVVTSIEYAMKHLGTRLLVMLGPAGNAEQKAHVASNLEKMKAALPEGSDLIKEKMADGEFMVKTAVYDLKTGQVDFE
jgi:carbonic anhydrase